MHADEAGVLFSDDAILRDTDRLGPWAGNTPAQNTQALIDFTKAMAARMKKWRPQLLTARNLYARTVLQPNAEAWTAQSLPAFLKAYDMTAIMAMPQLDQQSDRIGWYRHLVAKTLAEPGAADRALFEFATFNWRTKKRIDVGDINDRIRATQAAGARHIGYYPDDFLHNHPDLESIRPYISASDYPYPEPAR